jgi:sulfur carrier protein ThiS
VVLMMSEILREKIAQRIIVTETKTVRELLGELGLSKDHVVLIDGKRVSLDFEIQENDQVVVLPLIAGG